MVKQTDEKIKKYSKVVRYGKSETKGMFTDGDYIYIQEKIDGSSASFRVVDGELRCYSRNKELDEGETLRGFYNWVHENVDLNKVEPNYIYYGEWLVPHTVKYPKEAYSKFYLFDIFNTDIEKFLTIEEVNNHIHGHDIDFMEVAPLLYQGEFVSVEHIQDHVGMSKLGVEKDEAEGVVAKNYEFRDRNGKQRFAKFISDKFAEIAKVKQHKVSKYSEELDAFVDAYLTEARIEKMLHKLVDEGVINEDFAIEDMGTILKNSSAKIAEDIIDEEQDELFKLVRKKINKRYPVAVKDVLAKMDRM